MDLHWIVLCRYVIPLHGAWMIIDKLIFGNMFTASARLFCTFLGGVQLIGISILGEYIGRIYIEGKKGLST